MRRYGKRKNASNGRVKNYATTTECRTIFEISASVRKIQNSVRRRQDEKSNTKKRCRNFASGDRNKMHPQTLKISTKNSINIKFSQNRKIPSDCRLYVINKIWSFTTHDEEFLTLLQHKNFQITNTSQNLLTTLTKNSKNQILMSSSYKLKSLDLLLKTIPIDMPKTIDPNKNNKNARFTQQRCDVTFLILNYAWLNLEW